MALSAKLELRQSQSLVMTPQLMQAIKLLQLSNLDLVAYVDAEMERNPLLERDEAADAREGEGSSDGNGSDAGEHQGEADGHEMNGAADGENSDWLETRLETSAESIATKLDSDLGNVFPDDPGVGAQEIAPVLPADSWAKAPSRQTVSSDDYNLEAFVAEQKTLGDHLVDQLMVATADPALRMIGQTIINEIDETGYLRAEVEEIAERLGAPAALVETALALVQTFEPSGIAARDLAECLGIQLRERNRFDPAMAALIANLDLLARRDLAALRRLCGVDEEDLAEMIGEIKSLNPRPGSSFGPMMVQPVIPDVLVRPAPDGSWLIELNSTTLPRVLVNQSYYVTVSRGSKKDHEKAFLAECLQTANWLVKSLDQRAKTILKVATEIVRQQDAFLAHGVEHLRPLNLKSIADAIGMHESTVSRVTSNKYIATPRGIFELKYFFTSAIAAAGGGEAHSAEAVRHRIRVMIDGEGPQNVLSDDTIVQRLRESGVDIARRTVAKYREALRIPSSVQRRREKQAGL
ncbi:MAG: RNA polymerase factor sigma-54 [Bauldia sp.]|nr:RNA polymerase factor sigma-54 [Bauldia sp.]